MKGGLQKQTRTSYAVCENGQSDVRCARMKPS